MRQPTEIHCSRPDEEVEFVDSTPALKAHRRFLWACFAALISVLWLLPLGSSLWLDETGTAWIVRDGISQAISRSLHYGGVSPLYAIIVWVATRLFGKSEIAFRLPSFLAMVAAAYLVYRLGKRLIDREGGRLAAIVFSGTQAIAFAAVDARPYALGILAVAAATLALARWLDEGKTRFGVGFAFLAALTIYLHYLFATALVGLAIFAFLRRRESRISRTALFGVIGLTAGLISPAVPQLFSVFDRRHLISAGADLALYDLSIDSFLHVFFPTLLVAAVGIGLAISWQRRESFRVEQVPRQSALLAGLLLTIPAGVPYLFSVVTSIVIFVPRYILPSAIGLALIGAIAINSLEAAATRRTVIGLFVAVTILNAGMQNGIFDHTPMNWRAASSTVRQIVGAHNETPVLVQPQFVESRNVSWLVDPAKTDALLAPLAIYPMTGRIHVLPYDISRSDERSYVNSLLDSLAKGSNRFLLVTRDREMAYWIEARMDDSGFGSYVARNAGTIGVLVFERAH